jgi:hypothetical protein
LNPRPSGYEECGAATDQGERAKCQIRSRLRFVSFRVLDRHIAPSRAMDARWNPPDSDLVSAQAGQNAVFRSGPWSAFVGEPGTGKSNLLAAIRAALDPKAAPLTSEDVPQTGTGPIRIEASLRGGNRSRLLLRLFGWWAVNS